MRVDLSAVPRLVNSTPVAGCGAHCSEVEWATELLRLRPRCEALSYRELCDWLREMELGDLVGLVISAVLNSKPDFATRREETIGPSSTK
jgi:hypothetical protein